MATSKKTCDSKHGEMTCSLPAKHDGYHSVRDAAGMEHRWLCKGKAAKAFGQGANVAKLKTE